MRFSTVKKLLTLSFAFLVIAVLAKNLIADESDPPTITVSGTAEVRVVPDHAVLRFSIDSRAVELAAAVSDNDTKVTAVSQFLKDNKIESRSLRTELLRIQPIYETNSKRAYPSQQAQTIRSATEQQQIQPIGYSARRQISVTINDLSTFEAIYRGLVERGVNQVDNIQFQTTELRKHRDEARLQAVRAAREKATAMAGELDCTLAAVQSINESGRGGGWAATNSIQNVAISGGDSASSAVSGEISISATVSVVFILGKVEME